MTEEVRQALRICPPGCGRPLTGCRMPGPWRSCACAAGSRLPAGSRERSGRCRLPLSRRSCCAAFWSRQRSARPYAMQEMTRCGFVTLPGGHRLGICGTAVVQNGTITALREPSSLNLRIARQPDGIADRLRDALWARPQSVLLCGAPGSGKTTLLRDLIRQLSDRFGWRICVVDERLELAALCLRRAAIPPWRAHGRAVRCTEGGGASSCCCAR